MINTVKESLMLLKNSPLLILYSILADVAFLIFYTASGNIFSELVGNRVANYAPSLTKDFALYGYGALFKLELFYILLFLLSGLLTSYVVYCIFQGLAWWLAAKIVKQKNNGSQYLKTFFKLNLVWLLAYALYSINDFFVAFREKITGEVVIIKYPLLAIFVSVLLLALTSYVFQDIGKTLKFIQNNFLVFLKTFVFVAVLMFIVDRLLVLLRFNKEVQLFVGLLLVFISFAYSRVLLILNFCVLYRK